MNDRRGGASDPERLSLSYYDYALPPDLIAGSPAIPRDGSRLLVVERQRAAWTDSHFVNLAAHLEPGDLLVVNDTRVVKARLFGRLERTGRDVEILFANTIDRHSCSAMLRPARRIRSGDRIVVGDGAVFRVGEWREHGLRSLYLVDSSGTGIEEVLEAQGHMPLPPYIEREDSIEDESDYQTIYALKDGAIAAPTAGLHFSKRVFQSLEARGIQTAHLTLHVGIGTFVPIRVADPAEHRMMPERYEISEATADALNEARATGRRIIAVGTTTTRTLEHVFAKHGRFVPDQGATDLYILPGYRFAAIDGLVTNFHLPRSTLLLLVSAFASRELVMAAYRHAIGAHYRFYSYGDCTLFI